MGQLADRRATISTSPPAKLNLFLELRSKRVDGFHEIDTVMVPIDWCDELSLQRIDEPRIKLTVDWLPSIQIIQQRLGLNPDDTASSSLLQIPQDSGNLVHRALQRFTDVFAIQGGFDCTLRKRIPAGAGMGGASSNAASALRCAANLCGINLQDPMLWRIAEELGSDVPFFLGFSHLHETTAARGQGRGELLDPVSIPTVMDFVVAYPAVSLSTAKVYANSQIPQAPLSAADFIRPLERGDIDVAGRFMMNRLSEPAKKLAPQICGIIESLWQVGLRTCQLTGSGSACFGIAASRQDAVRSAEQLRARLEPGVLVRAVRSSKVPAVMNLT